MKSRNKAFADSKEIFNEIFDEKIRLVFLLPKSSGKLFEVLCVFEKKFENRLNGCRISSCKNFWSPSWAQILKCWHVMVFLAHRNKKNRWLTRPISVCLYFARNIGTLWARDWTFNCTRNFHEFVKMKSCQRQQRRINVKMWYIPQIKVCFKNQTFIKIFVCVT